MTDPPPPPPPPEPSGSGRFAGFVLALGGVAIAKLIDDCVTG